MLAAASAFTPLSPFRLTAQEIPAVSAAEGTDPAALPDWIPNDFESALNFRNTYGATRTADGFICIVYEEYYERIPEGEPRGILRYETVETKDMAKKRFDKIFGSEQGEFCYQVIVYDPVSEGVFEAALVDTWLKAETALDLGYSKAIAHYSFDIKPDKTITETDVYSWLPDCRTEYDAYLKGHGELSVRDNYVVFCLTETAGTPYSWSQAYNSGEYFAYSAISDCSPRYDLAPTGGANHSVYAFQAVRDGYDKISFSFGKSFGDEEPEKTLTADCVILDNAQTVLLANTARIRFDDAETAETLDFPSEENPVFLAPTIARKTEDANVYAYADLALCANSNPFLWDFSAYADADIFEINLNESALPEGYSLPAQYKKVRKYENGAMDVGFLLKKASAVKTYEAEITLLDYDTGEPLIICSDTEFSLCEHVYDGFDSWNPVIAKITENPCSLHDLPCEPKENQETILVFPRYYSYPRMEGTDILDRNYCKTELDENGVYHVTYRLKFTPNGDINGDRKFYPNDIAEMQKWLSGDPGVKAVSWKAADFNNDNQLDARDFTLMKRAYFAATQKPVAVSITESGGYMGIRLEWNVWEEDGKYLLYRWNRRGQYINGESVPSEKETFEITEAEYRKIMDIDYHTIIEEYDAIPHGTVSDGFYHMTKFTYADGTTRETGAEMSSALKMMKALYKANQK